MSKFSKFIDIEVDDLKIQKNMIPQTFSVGEHFLLAYSEFHKKSDLMNILLPIRYAIFIIILIYSYCSQYTDVEVKN